MFNEEGKTCNLRAPVAFTNMDMVGECRLTPNEPVISEPGIYVKAMDSLKNLRDIYESLERFRREIGMHEETAAKWSEPNSFVENVNMINDLTYAIKGDLGRLMKMFG